MLTLILKTLNYKFLKANKASYVTALFLLSSYGFT